MRMRCVLTCLVAATLVLSGILLLASHPIAAGPEPPTVISTADNTQRKVVRTSGGTLYVAATVNSSGVPQVRVFRTDDGASWTSLPPPSTGGGWSDRGTLAIDSRGRLHLAWTEPAGTNRQVYYARFDGSRWTPMEQLSDNPGYAGFPSIAVDGQDRVHLVWYGFDGYVYQIYYRRLEATGWTTEQALTSESVDATNPAIALGSDGVVHVAWFRVRGQDGDTEIAYLRFATDVVQESLAISQAGVPSIDPSIVVDGNGIVHVVWAGLLDGFERIQHASRGPGWSTIETISPASSTAVHPSLSLDATGRLYVAWEGGDGQVYYQIRNGTWSVPSRLTSAGVNRYPSLRWSQDANPLCGPNGKVDVVWTTEIAGEVALGYRALDAPAVCPPSTSAFVLSATAGVGIAVTAVATILAFFAWRHRRWYPKPPKER
jgi:hypothetical protein